MRQASRPSALRALSVAAFLSLAAACDRAPPTAPADEPDDAPPVQLAQSRMGSIVANHPHVFPYPGAEVVPVAMDAWGRVEGSARFGCVEGGTEVHVRVHGLIPGGLYTIWNLLFDGSGERTGIGSLGPADGSGNGMRADAHGRAALTTTVPAGPMSMSGSAGDCLLREAALVQLIVAYHTDDMEYGPVPGPAGTVVNHVRFSLHRELPRSHVDESSVLPFPGEAIAPVTMEEWNGARARAMVECTEDGTRVSMAFRGLIPGGVYTVWNLIFDEAGGRVAIGALGASDGSENGFVASASGRGGLTVVVPAGALSMSGSAGSCLLLDEAEFHFAAAYHVDGLNHGPTPGPAGTVFTQVGVIFVN